MTNILLIGLYVACELIANITASKPVALPLDIVVPSAVFIYALTFTLIDLINEHMGKKLARYVVLTAFIANLLLAIYVSFTIQLPFPPFYENQEAFRQVLGSTWRIVIASLTAHIVSSLIDISVFAWWKEKVGRFKWARVLISNTVSTFVDSVLFIGIAFLGVMPVWPLIIGQYSVKMAVTVVTIPMIYLIKHKASVSSSVSSQ